MKKECGAWSVAFVAMLLMAMGAEATPVVYYATNFVGGPYNRLITFKLVSEGLVSGGSGVFGTPKVCQPVNGVLATNLLPSNYTLQIDGSTKIYPFGVPDSTNTYNIWDLVNAGIYVLYSSNATAVAAGSNIVTITNAGLVTVNGVVDTNALKALITGGKILAPMVQATNSNGSNAIVLAPSGVAEMAYNDATEQISFKQPPSFDASSATNIQPGNIAAGRSDLLKVDGTNVLGAVSNALYSVLATNAVQSTNSTFSIQAPLAGVAPTLELRNTADNYSQVITLNQKTNLTTAGTYKSTAVPGFVGDGSGLTGLSASNVTSGPLPVSLLSTGLSAVAGPFLTTNGAAVPSMSYNAGGHTNISATNNLNQVFNVLAFGARPDGGDSTAAFQAAITACSNAGGGTVFFGSVPGSTTNTYGISSPLLFYQIHRTGNANQYNTGGNGPIVDAFIKLKGDGGAMLRWDGLTGTALAGQFDPEGVILVGPGMSNGVAPYFTNLVGMYFVGPGSRAARVKDCWITGFGIGIGNFLELESVTSSKVLYCGIGIQHGSQDDNYRGFNNQIYNCVVGIDTSGVFPPVPPGLTGLSTTNINSPHSLVEEGIVAYNGIDAIAGNNYGNVTFRFYGERSTNCNISIGHPPAMFAEFYQREQTNSNGNGPDVTLENCTWNIAPPTNNVQVWTSSRIKISRCWMANQTDVNSQVGGGKQAFPIYVAGSNAAVKVTWDSNDDFGTNVLLNTSADPLSTGARTFFMGGNTGTPGIQTWDANHGLFGYSLANTPLLSVGIPPYGAKKVIECGQFWPPSIGNLYRGFREYSDAANSVFVDVTNAAFRIAGTNVYSTNSGWATTAGPVTNLSNTSLGSAQQLIVDASGNLKTSGGLAGVGITNNGVQAFAPEGNTPTREVVRVGNWLVNTVDGIQSFRTDSTEQLYYGDAYAIRNSGVNHLNGYFMVPGWVTNVTITLYWYQPSGNGSCTWSNAYHAYYFPTTLYGSIYATVTNAASVVDAQIGSVTVSVPFPNTNTLKGLWFTIPNGTNGNNRYVGMNGAEVIYQ